MCKAIVEDAKSAGYSVHHSHFTGADAITKDSKHFLLYRGNQITTPFFNFCRLMVKTAPLQLFLNSRGYFSKYKELGHQTTTDTNQMRDIQR